jgi:hypothetical protein
MVIISGAADDEPPILADEALIIVPDLGGGAPGRQAEGENAAAREKESAKPGSGADCIFHPELPESVWAAHYLREL